MTPPRQSSTLVPRFGHQITMPLPQTLLPLLLLAALASGQVTFSGHCPHFRFTRGFDLRQWKGDWIEQFRYPIPSKNGQTCNKIRYKDKVLGTIKFVEKYHNGSKVTRKTRGKLIHVSSASRDQGMAAFRTQYRGSPIPGPEPDFIILKTDHVSRTIAWSCRDSTPTGSATITNEQHLFIMTKKRTETEEFLNTLKTNVDGMGLSSKELLRVNQKDCYN